mgnify:CR=1 FL=1
MSPIIGIAGIVFSLYYIFTFPTPGFTGYLDIPSLILLGVMPPCVMLLSHSIFDFLTGFKLLVSALFGQTRAHHKDIIETLTKASAMVRSDGLGAIMKIRDATRNELLRDGFSLIINDFKPEEIRHNLQAKINAKQMQMSLSANLFENMSKVCPGVGMIGTLLGLIGMLSDMKDPSNIGAGMALAMITTLYGLLLGTVLYAPFGEKIALEAEKNLEMDTLVLEGVLTLKGKKSSVHLKDIVNTYNKLQKGGAGGGQQPKQAPARRGA